MALDAGTGVDVSKERTFATTNVKDPRSGPCSGNDGVLESFVQCVRVTQKGESSSSLRSRRR